MRLELSSNMACYTSHHQCINTYSVLGYHHSEGRSTCVKTYSTTTGLSKGGRYHHICPSAHHLTTISENIKQVCFCFWSPSSKYRLKTKYNFDLTALSTSRSAVSHINTQAIIKKHTPFNLRSLAKVYLMCLVYFWEILKWKCEVSIGIIKETHG